MQWEEVQEDFVGAVNYEPQLFNGIVAQVPFVDVVTTMLDDTIL
jgi:oligopeptidase B